MITKVRIVECEGFNTPYGFRPRGSRADGYGKKISTQYEVQYHDSNKWYKVYAACFSNTAQFYTIRGYEGIELAINDHKCGR